MASEIMFSNNPIDWTALEGLYISELDPPGFITGVSLATAGIAGRCVRGPITVQDVTSPARFLEVYGGRDYGAGGVLIGEVWKALLNKSFGAIKVRRVVSSTAALATLNLSDVTPTAIVRVDASSVGIWANGATGGVTVKVEAASNAVSTAFNLRVSYLGKDTLYENLSCNGTDDNLVATVGTDVSRLVTLTKLANGRPLNGGPTNLAGGTEPALVDADYTAGITDIAAAPGASICFVPEAPPTPSVLNGTLVTLASTAFDRVFLTWGGVVGASVSTTITAVAAQITTRSDRIVWCYNTTQTRDPNPGTLVDQGAHVWMASIMSQTHPSVHKGSHETMKYLAGVASVSNPLLTRLDLIALKQAGISTLEQLSDGFLFRSAVTTSLVSGKTELSRRLMTDYIQLSAAARLKQFPKSKNTKVQRAQEVGELTAFCRELQQPGLGQTIDDDDAILGPGFYIDKKTVNTGAQRAKGLEFTLLLVRLVNHELYLVLQTEVGTGVVTVIGQQS